jgi:hypothetical protein
MSKEDSTVEAKRLLKDYQVAGTQLYIVGAFDTGVTVYSQQVRALNLVWASISSGVVPSLSETQKAVPDQEVSIAIVGAGFAGLTVAAALLKKKANARIVLFEQRDALLPLQQGSDSRWLHPRIYDWPKAGSEASVAMLPLLNWSAARASDVVVQVLSQWRAIADLATDRIEVFCNARHLQIHETPDTPDKLRIEWVGEARDSCDGTAKDDQRGAGAGASHDFDHVILATGFGLERDEALSYWRNETIAQPSLDEPRATYIISGQGDGAMIDLLRIRITQYRQDRILSEIFAGKNQLMDRIKKLYQQDVDCADQVNHFMALELISRAEGVQQEFEAAIDALRKRLRRDTEAILHLKVRRLSELFEPRTSRISFQNKVLVYLLYRCGGFVPSNLDEKALMQQYGISSKRVIRRHGTLRDSQLEAMMSDKLYQAIETQRKKPDMGQLLQGVNARWPGGFFDQPGILSETASDKLKSSWRREYLPGPTQLMATAFCAALAGYLSQFHPEDKRLRVALHRTMVFGTEELLQQACEYQGMCIEPSDLPSVRRTFPAGNGTIGLAYGHKRIIRSVRSVDPQKLNDTMRDLKLNEASRIMSPEVGFVLAIPLLERPNSADVKGTRVIGVIYVDSKAPGFFVEDAVLKPLLQMARALLIALNIPRDGPPDRISNVQMDRNPAFPVTASPKVDGIESQLEIIPVIEPPTLNAEMQINFDFADFLPIHS